MNDISTETHNRFFDSVRIEDSLSLCRTNVVDAQGDGFSCSSSPSLTSAPSPPPRSRLMHHLRRLAWPILLGQILSALIAVTGITSNYLVNFGVSLPLVQNLPSYTFLALIYGFFSWRHLFTSEMNETTPISSVSNSVSLEPEDNASFAASKEDNVVGPTGPESFCAVLWVFAKTRGWKYFIAGTIDVHANWAIVSAYNFTYLTSIQLLDCLTIPTAMILSRIFLKAHYRWMHVLGVLVCLAGAGTMVGADYLAAASVEASNNGTKQEAVTSTTSVLIGDFLVFLGAVGYGISNVYQEYLVRRYGIVDYLGFASLIATLWTLMWTLSLEYNKIVELIARLDQSNLGASIGCIFGYAGAMFMIYQVMPFALSRTNAVLVNLSLLTADIYALFIGIFLFQHVFHPLYIGAFVAIVLGIFLFASRDPIFTESVNNKAEDNA